MNSLRLNGFEPTNEKPPGANRGATVTKPSGWRANREKGTRKPLFAQSLSGRNRRAVPCLTDIQTFDADRQRMLRSWRILQQHLPADLLKAEEQATVSAMRQLRQLSQGGARHEKG